MSVTYTPNDNLPYWTQFIMIEDWISPMFDRPQNWLSEFGGYVYAHQYIGVCPFSHKVWVRAPILGKEKEPFAIIPMIHMSQRAVWGITPGSVIPRLPEIDHQPWIRYLPREVLNREVLMHIAAWEKK